MPLNPRVREIIEKIGSIDFNRPVNEIRRIHDSFFIKEKKEENIQVEDIKIPVDGGEIKTRIYYPERKRESYPLLVYYHGGGFVLGSIETHDSICRLIAKLGDIAVASVDYRLSPEYKFPTPVNDSYKALKWLYNNAEKYSLDSSKIAVGGDSAGGNLAAVMSLMDRDNNEKMIKYQILIYPSVNMVDISPSIFEFSEGYFLTYKLMRWFGSMYFANPKDGLNHYASPIFADLKNLPPSLVITAEYDPLRDQGETYSYLLKINGNQSTSIRYNGVIHGFVSFHEYLDEGRAAIEQISGYLKRLSTS
ncbi:alpha/beta hydrolase fold domain-containing protein [Acidianus sulfidivorans JP7]|uniref:Alpha/beta hydrolase n=1 Tax=Acidianus sulfidivorans JP7 TaxID=619593 RepID=A0A2U9IL56_9CREN|nr:alpha/beta hydrolase [Acidianus sulfidivorans]AWR96762.1 alpha/beta hydrolase fold domain-containing protein [Acidianus sulfidivorans JP7]